MPALSKDMTIRDVVTYYPDAEAILQEYGMHCVSCAMGGLETMKEAGEMHGYAPEDIDALLDDLHEMISKLPLATEGMTITEDAATTIAGIAAKEGKEKQALRVVLDGSGGFCLEFTDKKNDDDAVYFNENVPSVTVCVPEISAYRLNGAIIDMRDGRLKLDLPSVACCTSPEMCGCHKKNGTIGA